MRNEFKNMRRPLTSAEDVIEAKRKFGAKRPQTRKEEIEAIKRRRTEVTSTFSISKKHAKCFLFNIFLGAEIKSIHLIYHDDVSYLLKSFCSF